MRHLFFSLTILTIISCNPKKGDRIADENARNMSAFSKDSTTVSVIDLVHDFGKATEGDKVEYHYRFVNTGNKPMVIDNAIASCGCTVPEKPEKPVLPGDTGVIKVVFNSANRAGEVSKTITVQANVKPKFPELLLKGFVEEKK